MLSLTRFVKVEMYIPKILNDIELYLMWALKTAECPTQKVYSLQTFSVLGFADEVRQRRAAVCSPYMSCILLMWHDREQLQSAALLSRALCWCESDTLHTAFFCYVIGNSTRLLRKFFPSRSHSLVLLLFWCTARALQWPIAGYGT